MRIVVHDRIKVHRSEGSNSRPGNGVNVGTIMGDAL